MGNQYTPLLHKLRKHGVHGMRVTEYRKLVLRLNIEHIEYLGVEVLHIRFKDGNIKDNASYRADTALTLYTEHH